MRLRPAGEPYNRKTLSKLKRSVVRAQVGPGPRGRAAWGRAERQRAAQRQAVELRLLHCCPGVQGRAGQVRILHAVPLAPPLQVPHLPALPGPGEPTRSAHRAGSLPSLGFSLAGPRSLGPSVSRDTDPQALAAACPSSMFNPCRPWPSRAVLRTWARRRWSSSACGTSRGWNSSSTPSATCWPKHRPTAAAADPTLAWGEPPPP